MKASRREIELLIREFGVVSARHHPHLARSLQGLALNGELDRVLPGIYSRPDLAPMVWTRIRAVNLWDASAIVAGRGAAHWTFWSELPVTDVDVLVATQRQPRSGFRFSQRKIPRALTVMKSGVTCTCPALTAIELVPELGGDAIDTALRTGAADLRSMRAALDDTRGHVGNSLRAKMLLESRDLPWSAAERLLHTILRTARLRGWSSNQVVRVDGQSFFVDVLFRAAGLVLEVDGWEWHGRRMVDFQRTMHRHTTLEAAGWRVLHFTYLDLTSEPDWVLSTIRSALTHGRR